MDGEHPLNLGSFTGNIDPGVELGLLMTARGDGFFNVVSLGMAFAGGNVVPRSKAAQLHETEPRKIQSSIGNLAR